MEDDWSLRCGTAEEGFRGGAPGRERGTIDRMSTPGAESRGNGSPRARWLVAGALAALAFSLIAVFALVAIYSGEPFLGNLDEGNTPDLCRSGAKCMQPIAAALEMYFEQNGRYPGRLDELVPAYMERLPRLPQRFEDSGGTTYERMAGTEAGWRLQPFDLSAMLLVTLDPPVTLYYHPTRYQSMSPTRNVWAWSRYRHVERLDDNWVYCSGTRAEARRPPR
jgi:hypothetical protein